MHRFVPFAALCLALAVSGGCGKPKAHAPARPSPSPTPFAFDLQTDKLRIIIPDAKGQVMAVISGAKAGVGAPIGKSAEGHVVGTSAVLYRNGKPATTITAAEVSGDLKTHIVTARGGVTGRSEGEAPATTFRSDTMTWRPDSDKIVGKGRVLLTHGEMIQVPADVLNADTALKQVELSFGDAPVTGNL